MSVGVAMPTGVSSVVAGCGGSGSSGVCVPSRFPFAAGVGCVWGPVACVVASVIWLVGGLGCASAAWVPATCRGRLFWDLAASGARLQRALVRVAFVGFLMFASCCEIGSWLGLLAWVLGKVAALVVRSGVIGVSTGVIVGFPSTLLGCFLWWVGVLGGLLGGLFWSPARVVGRGLFGGSAWLVSLLSGGFVGWCCSDMCAGPGLLGFRAVTLLSRPFGGAGGLLASPFWVFLGWFVCGLRGAAGWFGHWTSAIVWRLSGFVVSICSFALRGLRVRSVVARVSSVLGAAAAGLAPAAFCGIQAFAMVGAGAFERLVGVFWWLVSLAGGVGWFGFGAGALGLAGCIVLSSLFGSVLALFVGVSCYLQAFCTLGCSGAVPAGAFVRLFDGVGLGLRSRLAVFWRLVASQVVTRCAGWGTWSLLLPLAPALVGVVWVVSGVGRAGVVVS
ncbi:hypothetical protein SAMN05192583_0542 [Sphingomonas gellani]|uniref:Uncharacterized protein n=1 Tax=Sphingomonas gellani TaxID=1166340 RepID=A0A1H7Z4F5_9SPHN|nr:hypothetical protein SAMN05192583_0542 [Sphingomonas gellani]